MIIKIIALGSIKDFYLKEGINEYLKRISPYAKIQIVEIAEQKIHKNIDRYSIKKMEAEEILKHLKSDEYLICLDEKGKNHSSLDFSKLIEKIKVKGKITFVIGGPLGLFDEIKSKSDQLLSLSEMTFTHPMARLILVEQIYRAFTIIAGKQYHY